MLSSLFRRTTDRLVPLSDRHIIWLPEPRLAYLRVPKAANSSIRAALAHRFELPGIEGMSAANDRYWVQLDNTDARIMTPRTFQHTPGTRDAWIFSFVRHPVARLYSCWNNKLIENEELTPGFVDMGLERGMDFADFVARVAELPDERCDIHVRSQASILTQNGRLLPHLPDDRVAPINAYGRSKLAGERAVVRAGGAHVILRTSWVFSSHGANFPLTMLRLGRERDRLDIVADQVGGPTPAEDIAHACATIAAHLQDSPEDSGIYHYSGAPDVNWAGFAREIFDRAGLACAVQEIATSAYPTTAARPLNSRLDCSAMKRVFGLDRPDWRTGLNRMLEQLAARDVQ